MRKVWVSREALIPKPFYKRKLFVFFVLLLLSSILFLAYQLFLVNKLSNSTEMLITEKVQSKATQRLMVASNPKREVIRGIRIRDIDNYTKLWTNQKFKCLDGSTEIEWEKINDDFCDCPDGTDETLTNVKAINQLVLRSL